MIAGHRIEPIRTTRGVAYSVGNTGRIFVTLSAAATYAKLHPSEKTGSAALNIDGPGQNGIAGIELLSGRSSLMISGPSNPKQDAPSGVEKDPNEWVSGDDPMTASQAS